MCTERRIYHFYLHEGLQGQEHSLLRGISVQGKSFVKILIGLRVVNKERVKEHQGEEATKSSFIGMLH